MSQDLNLFTFQRVIRAPVGQIYRCFTTAPGFQEWLCRSAYLSTRPGGFLTLSWHSGFYTLGEYVRLEPDKEVLFTWHGRGEPQPTQVQVLLSGEGERTHLELIHSCIGGEEIWVEARKAIETGWEKSLLNLESVLTTGVDQRLVNRPAIGIYPIELNPELAAISALPVVSGIYLNDVIPGRSAAKAGLMKGDVIVAIDGEPVEDLPTLVRMLQSCLVGSEVLISYYRGKIFAETRMEILALPLPDVPLEPDRLAAAVQSSYSDDFKALRACFADLADTTCEMKSGLSWSAKEVLAHLIHTERDLHVAIQSALVDQTFTWTDNTSARVKATLAAFPTCAELIEELQRTQVETVAMLENLPQEFTTRKSSLWQLGYTVLTMKSHTQEHLSQIEIALQQS